MKVVILAGGLGTRLIEETKVKPKPMVEVGGMPILWHIMKTYSHFGFNEFIICLGYKGQYVKDWFSRYMLANSDVTFDMRTGEVEYHRNGSENWKVTLVDTGMESMTGGRLARIKDYVGDEPFLATYGDGVSDVDIAELVQFHKNHGKVATMTVVHPEGRFGIVDIDHTNTITKFSEKTDNSHNVNGGFFVFEPNIFSYIKDGDSTILEKKPFEELANDGELMAFEHNGFWKPMDSLRDKDILESHWENGAPWKRW